MNQDRQQDTSAFLSCTASPCHSSRLPGRIRDRVGVSLGGRKKTKSLAKSLALLVTLVAALVSEEAAEDINDSETAGDAMVAALGS